MTTGGTSPAFEAQPGEIERLRAEVAALRERVAAADAAVARDLAERNRQREMLGDPRKSVHVPLADWGLPQEGGYQAIARKDAEARRAGAEAMREIDEPVIEAVRKLGDAMDNCQTCDAEFHALWDALDARDRALPTDTDAPIPEETR